jgi:FkbM family methyltransferase
MNSSPRILFVTDYTRYRAKTVLQKWGLFPIARTAYRVCSRGVRKQQAHEISFYSSLIPPGALCFDIGANLGQKTEVLLACGAHVVSVEPNPLCYPTLRHLFGKNKNCYIVPSAVGKTNGSIDLYIHGTDATGSVRPEWDKQIYGFDRGATAVKTPLTTLDALIELHGKPDFINIDVEGFEVDVLSGLSSSIPLLSFEYHSAEIVRTEECLKILSRLGTLLVRASDEECNWLAPRTDGVQGCLQRLYGTSVKGDLLVWMS